MRRPLGVGAFKDHLIRAAYDKYNSADPQKFARLRDRITSMDADHIQDFQLGGLDEFSNIWLLDREVNQGLGPQIWQQIKVRDATGEKTIRSVARLR